MILGIIIGGLASQVGPTWVAVVLGLVTWFDQASRTHPVKEDEGSAN